MNAYPPVVRVCAACRFPMGFFCADSSTRRLICLACGIKEQPLQMGMG